MTNGEGFVYTVKDGDTLSKIAKRYGIASWREIYKHDNNKDFRKSHPNPNLIYRGDSIWIPIASPNQVAISNDKKNRIIMKKAKAHEQFTLKLIDLKGAEINENVKFTVNFSDGISRNITSAGGSTVISYEKLGEVKIVFDDAWVPETDEPFDKSYTRFTVNDGDTHIVKILLLKEGDILLRAGSEPDSVLIMKITQHPYSHAGIVIRGKAGYLMACDAYPGRDTRAVGADTAIKEFFAKSHATSGLILRYTGDESKAKEAAKWAYAQIAQDYEFSIMDEFTNNNNKLYCAEFVWRAYKSQGINLVPDPVNFKSPDKKENTINALIDYAYESNEAPKIAPRKMVRSRVEEHIASHSGMFIAPYQLNAGNLMTELIDIKVKTDNTSQNTPDSKKK